MLSHDDLPRKLIVQFQGPHDTISYQEVLYLRADGDDKDYWVYKLPKKDANHTICVLIKKV
jgi:hypothetical protein